MTGETSDKIKEGEIAPGSAATTVIVSGEKVGVEVISSIPGKDAVVPARRSARKVKAKRFGLEIEEVVPVKKKKVAAGVPPSPDKIQKVI